MIKYIPENGKCPWVVLVGRYNTIWHAFPTEELAKANFDRLVEGFKTYG